MCSLCEENGTLFNIMDEEEKELDLCDGVMSLEDDVLTIEEFLTGDYNRINFKINYCPICGREL